MFASLVRLRSSGPRGPLGALVLLLSILAAGSSAAPAAPLRVLLLSGENNHDWRKTTPALRQVLEDAGRFEVVVTESPQSITAESLRGFDAVLSNWNTFTSRTAPPREAGWSDATRSALIEFVRGGKGYVTVHAGSASFSDWEDYQRMALGTFKIGQTSHGKYHAFDVAIAGADHPVTRGLGGFNTIDELWHDTAFQPGVTVLATAFSSRDSGGSGKQEPVAVAGAFGSGRSVFIVLGHDERAIRNQGFRALLVRGTEWACTGVVTARADAQDTTRAPCWLRDGGSIALTVGEQVVWRFHYESGNGKPHFDPLAPVQGPSITWRSPPDHPWHYGLWFSWKLINGVNYWEEDRATHKPAGETRVSNVSCDPRPDGSASLSLDLQYGPEGKPRILKETRTIEISAPAEDGSYRMDWTMVFTVGKEDLLFDRTPPPGEKDGKPFGGYAGLSLRMQKLASPRGCDAAGPIAFNQQNRSRAASTAFDYSGEIDGRRVGVATFDHPANRNSPTPWYAIRDNSMCFYNAALLCNGPAKIRAGGTFTLRYRVVVHRGEWDSARLRREAHDFAPPKAPEK